MEEVASLTIAAVGAAMGLLGLIVAIRANGHAKAANGIAEAAKDEAHRANEISVAANDLSRESNAISVSAKDLSVEANSISRQAHALELERHDVTWEFEWEGPGSFVLTNDSDDEALRVRAVVSVDSERGEAQVDLVPGRGVVVVELPGAKAALRNEDHEMALLEEGFVDLFDSPEARQRDRERAALEAARRNHVLTVRITWNSALGKPHHFNSEPYLGRLSGG